MIRFPTSVAEALSLAAELDGEYRAGGTDLQDRRAHLAVHGPDGLAPILDLRDLPGLDQIESDRTGARIGASISLAQLAEDPTIRGLWPGIAEAAGALANPQIREVASLAGNLMQAPRCWYYRHPDYTCLRKGGTSCHAREGDHLFHVCYDEAPCVAPHPSTVALALLGYDAEVEYAVPGKPEPQRAGIAAVLEADALAAHALITTIHLGPPLAREQTAYARASNRAHAEWALAEVSVRLVLDAAGAIEFIRVAVGAVAPTPRRMSAVEDALLGQVPSPETLAAAAARVHAGATPLAQTGYKLALLEGCVVEALELALGRSSTPAAITDSSAGTTP